MTRVLIATAPFKGTLSAREATAILGERLRVRGLVVDECPLPDGGEGTLDALARALRLTVDSVDVEGVLGHPPTARVPIPVARGVVDGVATVVIESASCVGLTLVPPGLRDPERASSASLGRLLRRVIDDGGKHVLLGLGGSGVVDGGAGLLAVTGRDLLTRAGARVTGLVDVDAPLCGLRGARLYFAQKGLPADRFDVVEERLRALHPSFVDTPGAGAAGGLGAAVLALGGSLTSGAETVIRAAGLAERVRGADVVVGGEGCVDEQTLQGKSLARLKELARAHRKRFVVVCGACTLPEPDVADVVVTLGPSGLLDPRGALARAAEHLP